MDQIKTYLKRSLLTVIFFNLLLLAVAVAAHYPQINLLLNNVPAAIYVFVFVMLFSLLEWMFLRNGLVKSLSKAQLTPAKSSKAKMIKTELPVRDREKEANERRREFLHLFSVLQREGRLMDFFAEELEQYDDAQIGAAVRDIHTKCKKTISKYFQPKPVIAEEEGGSVEIPVGFDQAAVKLTGNVVGEPPFKGIVRHRGWQAKKFDPPILSETQNPLIIAPAEIEIE